MEIFEELVRSGVVRPEDEIFDVLTGLWVKAARHPMVTLFKDPLADDDGASFGLDLVEHPEESPEEAQRAFIERMEEERRQDPDRPEISEEITLVAADSEGLERSGPTRNPAPPPVASPEPPRPRRPRIPVPPLPVTTGLEVPPSPEVFGYSSRRDRRRPSPAWKVGAAALMVAVPTAVVFFSARASSPTLIGEVDAAATTRDVRNTRPVPQTEEQIRVEAYGTFVDAVDELQGSLGVGDVPAVWLQGYYLADPAHYPEVRLFWKQYLALAQKVDVSEATLFRRAYLDAATRAGVSGPVRSLRMAAAAGDFEAFRPERVDVYERVKELAAAALALDDLCLELSGRISYEPIRGPRLSGDPVIEATGKDKEAQARLDAALDRVLVALQEPGEVRARDRQDVTSWLVSGLREVRLGARQ